VQKESTLHLVLRLRGGQAWSGVVRRARDARWPCGLCPRRACRARRHGAP
jgi:hypothetical protein